jgi:DNA replication and repair protein RecF
MEPEPSQPPGGPAGGVTVVLRAVRHGIIRRSATTKKAADSAHVPRPIIDYELPELPPPRAQPPPGPTLLYGANAQGKTNLLEAIYYLATTRSHHAEQDSQLLNWDHDEGDGPLVVGRLVGHVMRDDGERLLEMRLIREQQAGQASFRREALVNRRKVRLMDLLGNLRVVLFLPQDVQMVSGPPAERRRYMDITLCQTDPEYCRSLSRYNKHLEQRNAVLRRIAEEGRGHDLAASLY